MRSQQGNGEQQKQPLSVLEEEVGNSWAYIVCTVAICFTGIPIVLIRSLLWTAVAVLAHSSLRQSPLECVAAKKGVGQSGISPSVGVPFLEVASPLRVSFRNPCPPKQTFYQFKSTFPFS